MSDKETDYFRADFEYDPTDGWSCTIDTNGTTFHGMGENPEMALGFAMEDAVHMGWTFY